MVRFSSLVATLGVVLLAIGCPATTPAPDPEMNPETVPPARPPVAPGTPGLESMADADPAVRPPAAGCPGGHALGESWTEECNTCRCEDDGQIVCTRRACMPAPVPADDSGAEP